MPGSPVLPGLRQLVILASALIALILFTSASALASGPMEDPMNDPAPAQPTNQTGKSGQSGTGSAGQPGGTGDTGSSSQPGQAAQSGGAANPAPKAAANPAATTTKKSATPTHTSTRSAPVRSSQTSGNTGGNIETIVQLPQPTAKLEAGPAPTGTSSGEPTVSLIEVASTAQPASFPYAMVAMALGVLALAVLLVPSFRGMPRPAVGRAADPV